MSMLSGVSEFFGLDIGTTAIRLVELHGSGKVKALVKYAYLPVDSKVAQSDAKSDQQKLIEAIRDLLAQAKITTRNVAVGVPSQRVFTTIVDVDRLSPSEIAKTLQYQADSLIPTPPSESKIEWAVIGDSPKDKNKVEVLLSSITNEFVESRLDMLESIGLNVIAFEPDYMALARAVVPIDVSVPQMVVDIGSRTTDLVISYGGVPRLARSIPTGSEAIIRAAMQNLGIDQKQAEQFVDKFGMNKDKLEGQIYNAIVGTIEILVTEMEKSIKFFQSRYGDVKIDRIIMTGGASSLPEFPLYVANRFGLNVEIGNAWRNVSFPSSRQNELIAAANHFAVAAGLAERKNKMVQFNLLPDIKMQYIKARRQKHTMLAVSIMVAASALTVFVLLFVAVNIFQRTHISNLDKDIKDYTKQIKATPELNKVLTVQNQLNSIPGLLGKRPIASRLFEFMPQLAPNQVTISNLNVDFTTSTMNITGSADAISTVNKFVDTLKFTNYTVTGSDGVAIDKGKPFKNVVMSSFGKSEKETSYQIALKFEPTIFDGNSKIALVVPKIISTRSETEKPTDLFKALPQPKAEGN